jgi:transcriptional regulator with PAS, ATPase and Fis domain
MNIETRCRSEKRKLENLEDHANPSRAVLSSQGGLGGLIGESAQMHHLHELIVKVSKGTSPVLLLGETGTGKELVARAIHFAGLRRGKALVTVDCSALAPTLVESEMFGHVKGAFTGADHSKMGLLETANEGTIFLDEIGELALFLQAKLLRALQEKEIRPVGSTMQIPIDARVIAATNRDLERGVLAGTFRQDLYFRLNVVQIRLPALRDRKVDIPLLVTHFLEKFSDPRHPVREISSGGLQRLMAYDWPGNVRELENTVESAVALSSGTLLTVDDLTSVPNSALAEGLPDRNELVPLEELERRAIFHAIRETKGDKLAAACLLGIGKTTLYRKLKHYGYNGARFRARSVSRKDAHMEDFLICTRPKCRELVDLHERHERGAVSGDLPRDCPECGHFLSRFCPFCRQSLDVHWQGDIPHCKYCGCALSAEDA